MTDERLAAFEAQIARIRESGWLGRSLSLARLFDFLADARRGGRTVREADVAHEVFGRGDADLSSDASVRVYIHRLRKKLVDFYAGPGASEPHRLMVPLGEYRLDLEAPAEAPVAAAPAVRAKPSLSWGFAAAALALVLAVNLAGWLWAGRAPKADRDVAALARTAPWSAITGQRPVIVVVGDYYIFGESDGLEVRRMIREFDVNSPEDLNELLMRRPELQGRYVDLDTDYTPTGATLALKNVLPVVRAAVGDRQEIQIITSSKLTPDMLKSADIIYVGYLSALRLLQQPVFAGARLKVGDTYDDLVDNKTGRLFTSSAAEASPSQQNVDYGYLRAVTGPSGNHIIAIAGTRDIGVMQMAETATSPGPRPEAALKAGDPVEVLYEVRGVGRTNISARPVDFDRPR